MRKMANKNPKKIIQYNEIEIVGANDIRTRTGNAQRKIAYLSKKLDLDYSYIYTIYCELFPDISPVAFKNDEAMGYIASIIGGCLDYNKKTTDYSNAFIFIKQWAVLPKYRYKKCEVINKDGKNTSIMEMLTNNLIKNAKKYKIDKFILTIKENNTASLNLAKRTAANNGLKIYSPGYIKYGPYNNYEQENYWIIAKNPKKVAEDLKNAGYLKNMQNYE